MTKKKITKASIIMCLVLMLFGISACSGNSSGEETANKQGENDNWLSFPDDMASKGFLPQSIVDDFPGHSISEDSEGVLYLWSISDENSDMIHKIELAEKDDDLIFYHYKNYSFDVPNLSTQMTKDEALNMVNDFATTFIKDGDKLIFENGEGSSSLYRPGHVEGWIADTGIDHHTVMVDFDMGSIIYYACETN